jgi:hypothetical protein
MEQAQFEYSFKLTAYGKPFGTQAPARNIFADFRAWPKTLRDFAFSDACGYRKQRIE